MIWWLRFVFRAS